MDQDGRVSPRGSDGSSHSQNSEACRIGMQHKGIQFTPLTPFPRLRPSPAAVCPSSIGQYIGHGDTVKITGAAAGNWFLAMVVVVCHSRDDERPFQTVARHPSCSPCPSGLELLMRLFVLRDECQFEVHGLGVVDEETRSACSGLQEAVQTNCALWVTPNLVEKMAFICHALDVKSHTFGTLAGRDDTYYLLQGVVYNEDPDDDSDEHTFYYIDKEGYPTFGGNTDPATQGVVTYTERMLHALSNESEKNRKLLNGEGDRGTKSTSICQYMGYETFRFLKQRFDSCADERGYLKKSYVRGENHLEMKRCVHANLDVHSKLVPKNRELLVALTSSQFETCQRAISSVQGIGVKRELPKRATIARESGDLRSLRSTLQPYHTLNTVFIDPAEHSDEDGYNFGAGVSQERIKRLKVTRKMAWSYNHNNQWCTTSVKCIPVVASSEVDAVHGLLLSHNVNWEAVAEPEASNNRQEETAPAIEDEEATVEINDTLLGADGITLWYVVDVNNARDRVTVVSENRERETWSMDVCMQRRFRD